MPKTEYAKAGVNYQMIEPFKQAMIREGRKTLSFPNKRDVFINEKLLHGHGAVFEHKTKGLHQESPIFCMTQEGLGNKNWIAEWMYQYANTGRTYYEGIGFDACLVTVNAVIAQGALPVVYTGEVASGDSEWFADEKRANDLARGYYEVCKLVGMALLAGGSPSLQYLVRSEPLVKSAPSLSGCVTGIISPRSRLITGEKLSDGDIIIGVTSSGIHTNGISLVIKRALGLKDAFLTKLPNGNVLGEEALIPTRSYAALMEALFEAEIDIHSLIPATEGGVKEIACDERPFMYYIYDWPKVPVIFQFMRELGVSLTDCLRTFNWGIGYYIFVPEREVARTLEIGKKAGYELFEVGIVLAGRERRVDFRPKGYNIALLPS